MVRVAVGTGVSPSSHSCVLSQADVPMFPVPRRDIHHRFNAIGTFTTNGLIRDASTFFILGAPVGWSRFYLFTGGCGDDGNMEPVRAEKGKVVKYPYLFSKCSVLSLEMLLVQVCEEQSVLGVSNVLPCGTTLRSGCACRT